ncbi:antibiotic ABC transporter ATP-binding protein [Flavipsychrobacter stenotrophus]|uniref:Antibiotic ABC transporter ATP-binding protein n=1 Tax=Flavipsychrobacter stenotrophus TaxID=2077091 RepID=A0A2S7SSZ4_9BACT|nr:ABC transporter ATP-binding protein [Flavipsychrobacter stenotrophus]PQJ09818.1 antibiotic ABC transporter ATP-binding protein [Flavipsychrobacter stenotrophus]
MSKTKEPKKKLIDLHLLRRLFSYTAPYKKTLQFSLFLSISLAMVSPLRPYLIQFSVDHYIKGHMLDMLIRISALQLVILMVESFVRFWFMYRINWLGQTVVNDIRKAVFKKILFQNIAYYDKNAIGMLTTRTVNDLESVNDVFSEGIISIAADVMTILSIITVMLFTDWRLTLVCLAVFPILIVATYIFKESVNKSFQRVRNAVAALNAFVQEHLTGMYIVQVFAAEQREMNKFKEINKEHRNANIKGIFAYSVFFPVVEIILALSLGLLVWYGAVRYLHHGASMGVIIAFVMYINLLFRPLRMLADKFNVLQMGVIAGERVFGVLDSQENMQHNGTLQPATIKGAVEFKDVRFSYKEGVPVLKGVSFKLDAGKTMAVVGHTGAGKSSLISILNRQYEISSGEIFIDGINLHEYDIYTLRQHVGIVLQDVFLFSGTIYDNITLRNTDIPVSKVEEVAKILGIHDFIMRLPGGYHFDIMERGNTLSQGQRQLLSFARALLYNPSILILDEATSSVDSESEQLIQHAIDTLIKGRTSIVIAHRLSTIRMADEIIVMDHGVITERGSHEELISLQGSYHNLYTAVEQTVIP